MERENRSLNITYTFYFIFYFIHYRTDGISVKAAHSLSSLLKKDLKPGLFFKIITQVYYIRIDLSVSGDYIKNSIFF